MIDHYSNPVDYDEDEMFEPYDEDDWYDEPGYYDDSDLAYEGFDSDLVNEY